LSRFNESTWLRLDNPILAPAKRAIELQVRTPSNLGKDNTKAYYRKISVKDVENFCKEKKNDYSNLISVWSVSADVFMKEFDSSNFDLELSCFKIKSFTFVENQDED